MVSGSGIWPLQRTSTWILPVQVRELFFLIFFFYKIVIIKAKKSKPLSESSSSSPSSIFVLPQVVFLIFMCLALPQQCVCARYTLHIRFGSDKLQKILAPHTVLVICISRMKVVGNRTPVTRSNLILVQPSWWWGMFTVWELKNGYIISSTSARC